MILLDLFYVPLLYLITWTLPEVGIAPSSSWMNVSTNCRDLRSTSTLKRVALQSHNVTPVPSLCTCVITSERSRVKKGYGFRLIEVPNLLLVHMPTASRSGKKYGWHSEQYKQSINEIDSAIGKIRDNYRELNVLDKTMFLVTSLNAAGLPDLGKNGKEAESQQRAEALSAKVPWIASGNNVKKGMAISRKVSLQDTGATILYALGLKTHTEWESQAIDEIFETTPEHRTTENDMPASLY